MVPEKWLNNRFFGMAFLYNGNLYHITEDSVVKANASQKKGAGRTHVVDCTTINDKVILISKDNSLNMFVNSKDKVFSELVTMSFCLGIVCPKCGTVHRDIPNFKRHKQQHDDLVKCPRCPPDSSATMDKFMLRKHMKHCVIKCMYEGCTVEVKDRKKMEMHIRKHERSLS